jgi:D-lactate dehydrogenase
MSARPALSSALEATGAEVASRASDRLGAAHDASHYLLTPLTVVTAHDSSQVSRLMATSREQGVPVTFRSGGTSLSGQAGTDGILIDVRRGFRDIAVLDAGERVRVQPGATVRAVNARLLARGRRLGPDPASEVACTIGGVIANNSSGMSCGTHANAYRTIDSVVLVLASGMVLDTGADDADALLRQGDPIVHEGLRRLRDRVRSNSESVATLRRLHTIKNTMGYGLNSFLDHDDPADILEHLVVGSEGTLAFIAEATFRTVPIQPAVATGLLLFHNIAAATAALPELVAAGFATIELMDAAALRVAQRDPEATAQLREVDILEHAALLVEFQEESAAALEGRLAASEPLLARLPLVGSRALSADARERAQLWHVRKGLYAAVAGARPSGTTALLEDIAVPVDRLNATCTSLIAMFERHGYDGSVIFGHAKDGNIHFLINERFDDAASLRRYDAFTEEMVSLVLAHGGTLKAEHGTGRMMAPFVRRQYGDELYDVMWEVKRLLDPHFQLNPGVLLNEDPAAHMQNLKSTPSVEEEVDRCVECGYCEPVCPSQDLTLTPRQRIVLRREIQRARDVGDHDLALSIERDYAYDGVQTCAVDGMCKTACPVLINTGDLVRRLRAEGQGGLAQAAWKGAAERWGIVSSAGSMVLDVAGTLPAALPGLASRVGRAILGTDTVPLYTSDLPRGGARRPVVVAEDPSAVFFPSCTGTMFGPVGDDGVAESLQRLCERAGIALATPAGISQLCCGTPWKSKGLLDGYEVMKKRVAESLLLATEGGKLPVISDASSCTEGLTVLLEAAGAAGIRVVDAVQFVDEHVLPKLPQGTKVATAVLHPTCSSRSLGIDGALARVAAASADAVVVPDDWGCCAFAGDRGMLHPELTASATAAEARSAVAAGADAYVSLNRTCEMGMTRATGIPYRHILQLLDDTLR